MWYSKLKLNNSFLHRVIGTFSCRNGSSGKAGEANPFEEEEWDENDALVDNGEPGVPVKALYDYEGAENDELSFKQGKPPFSTYTIDLLMFFLYR